MKVRDVIKLRVEVTMYRYLVVIEKAGDNFSAYAPDLPGCVATGATLADVELNMHEAMQLHIRGLAEDDLPIPESVALAEYMAFPANV